MNEIREIRDTLLNDYPLDKESGLIKGPGKFEGEPIYAPYFSEYATDGEVLSNCDDDGTFVSLIEISAEDREIFPELDKNARYILITEGNQGFVEAEECDEKAAARIRQSFQEDEN